MRGAMLFGSSGIRGLVGERITPELSMAVGAAVGTLRDEVLLGRDPRVSGPMLAAAFAAGAMAVGADVTDAGMVSTPTLARGAREYDAGVVVTASHNPAEYNGIKLWNPDGLAFTEAQQAEVEAALERGAARADWRFAGGLATRTDLGERHAEAILARVGAADLTVAVDCGCGATSHLTPAVLRRMGCRVLALNAHPDGHFPGRDPEPTEENLGLLIQTVKATGADLGIAHDGDGDRMVAVDDRGRYVGGDRLLPLFAKIHARKAIVVPVDASMVLDDLLPGVAVHRTRVGDVYVGQEVRRTAADFGGEPSGTWIFPAETLCPDGPYAAAHLVALLKARGRKLSEMLDEIPQYPLLREGHRFEPGSRDAVVASLEAAFGSVDADVSRVDGWRAGFDDGWVVVRLSGTEPKVRVTAEARERARAEELMRWARGIVQKALAA
jgi:phosphoglucosamine mutase